MPGKYLINLAVFFAFTFCCNSCKKAETILLISKHKWYVSQNSPDGIVGSSYHFMDNRLFFYQPPNGAAIEGKWSFYSYSEKKISIDSDNLFFSDASIHELNPTNLELNIPDNTNSQVAQQIVLVPAQ
jgi:hypothetical protein